MTVLAKPLADARGSDSAFRAHSPSPSRDRKGVGPFAFLILLCACALAGGQKNTAYAVVEGAVFHDPGLALPHAKVVLQLRDDPKSKKQEITASERGEFEFHVPATAAVYVVKATMKGFQPDQKEAAIAGGAVSGQERVTVNLVLSPESK
jgi:hypothetical protein